MEKIIKELENSPLSDNSVRVFKSKLNRLFSTKDFPKKILDSVIPEINVNENKKTELAYVSNLRTMIKHSDTLRDMIGKSQIEELETFNDEINKVITKEYEEQEKRDNDIEWEEVLEAKEKIKNKDDLLIFLLYTDIPTQRIDFTPMLIVEDEDEADDENINYYVKKTEQFIFNSYKTAKSHGQNVVDATPEIAKLINDIDTEWLFQDKSGNPVTDNALSKRITKVFTKYIGKHVSMTQIRRSQCSLENRGQPSIKEKEDQAKKRGHTDSMKQKYAFKSDCKYTTFKGD
jgi:hypothetical protein